ncbi:MAG: hypothetical protein FJZ01_15695 [Candidatus Sericytochromatia bacterium]|nr:hypothetical protein [Candidatus Tanganyikabacteria bacterium]
MATVSGVGPGFGPLPPGGAGATSEPAAPGAPGAPDGDAAAGGDTSTISAAGASSLIGADGKVRTGWGLVDAPPVMPTDPGKLIEMKKYGDMEVPNPKPDIEGPPVQNAEVIAPPSIARPPEPIKRNKFSITTGPPYGDP